MVETRRHFQEQLDELESIILRMGVASHDLFRRALDVVATGNEADADAVIAGDDEVDAFYMEIERGIVVVFATQGPVASDLRFLATLLHINLHLERVADMGVNIAKIAKAAHGLPPNPRVLQTLQDNGVRLMGTADHGMTHSLYLADPDGNEIELYVDVPGVDWDDPDVLAQPTQPLRI